MSNQIEKKEGKISVDKTHEEFDTKAFYERLIMLRKKLKYKSWMDFGGRTMYNAHYRNSLPTFTLLIDIYHKSLTAGINLNLNWLLFNHGDMELNNSLLTSGEDPVPYLKKIVAMQDELMVLKNEIKNYKGSE